jgi:predicted RNase H-like nuclease
MTVVGIDGCRKGWIAVELAAEGPPIAHFLAHIAELADAAPDAEVVAIDIPIGFPRRYPRRAEVEARALLEGQASSVFMTPPRRVLAADTYAEANRIAREMLGQGISRQSYGLRRKIFEVDEWLETAHVTVVEVHPEISFRAMLGRRTKASKKTWVGMVDRRSALRQQDIEVDELVVPVESAAGVDDVLDAAAAAWSARRVASGAAVSLPPRSNATGTSRRLAIWY